MDNAILIIAGEAIDENLGVILGISTMCAAAVGNIISDVAVSQCFFVSFFLSSTYILVYLLIVDFLFMPNLPYT